MTRPAPRDQPNPDETAKLADSLRAEVEAARARPASTPAFGRYGGILRSTDGSLYVRVEISAPNTTLTVVDAASALELDDWVEPTDLLLHRLSAASAVDYDAAVKVG